MSDRLPLWGTDSSLFVAHVILMAPCLGAFFLPVIQAGRAPSRTTKYR